MKKITLAFIASLTFGTTDAQQIRPASSQQIYHEIKQLNKLVNVLYLAAHPDDENTRLLAWLVNDRHVRTAYLSLTRGDGGQNILGSEQGPALGLIRTHELLEARKMDGAEQFFTRAVDFGYSKNAEETFKHWDKEILIGDVVWIYRKYRPDVVICRFPPNEQAGHGQHAASAIIAAEAFEVSGNKNAYEEQLQHYAAWQPKRLLFNAYRFGSRNTTSEDQFQLEVGQYSPLLGMGYGELAGKSRSIHRSQGAGTPSTPGTQTEYFKLVAGDTLTNSLFDGIDITWGRVGRPEVGQQIKEILSEYDFRHPERSLPDLLDLRKEIATVKDDYWRIQKLQELDKIIVHSAGFMAELYTKTPETTDDTTLPFTLRMIARSGGVPVRVKSVSWTKDGNATDLGIRLKEDSLYTFEEKIFIPKDISLTEPYWLSVPNDDALYPIPNDTLLGYSTTPNDLTANVTLSIGEQDFDIAVPLSYKKLDPTHGDVIEPLRIVPDVTLDFASSLLMTNPDGTLTTNIHVRAFEDLKNVDLFVRNNEYSKVIKNLNFTAGTDTLIPLTLTTEEVNKAGGKDDFYLTVMLVKDRKGYSRTQHLINYEHLPTLQYFTQPYAKVLRRDWKVTAKRIGYIEGAGDYTLPMLRSAGLQVDVLKPSDLASATRLKKYDAIVTGIRSINTQKEMRFWMPVLMEYVQNGGTLVMQYNTTQDMSTKDLGPYPFTLSYNRVTEEDAEVTFIAPNHRILNYPNKITKADFEGWVQERGLYFPDKWDEHYQPLFSMHDTNEEPIEGATLYTTYGKGHYIYTPLSFFRQLPAGNKGAIRLLMNMISVGK